MNEPSGCQCVRYRTTLGDTTLGDYSPDPNCDTCGGTGKVWPSVPGEFVAFGPSCANRALDGTTDGVHALVFVFSGVKPGRYRAIIQPVEVEDETRG